MWIDDRFEPGDRRAIELAINRWNVALNGYAEFDVSPEHVRDPATDAFVRLEALWLDHYVTIDRQAVASDPTLLAWVDKVGGSKMNVLPDRLEEADWPTEPIVLHEFGHVLGLADDTHHLQTLMATPVTAMTRCIDERTAIEVAGANGWDGSHMTPECP